LRRPTRTFFFGACRRDSDSEPYDRERS
jgi:hypothetical protein